MASDINRVILVGRLTRDPELKSTQSGSYFCRFTLASNRSIFRKDQENKEEVGFFDCVAWGKLAEVISKYLSKGRRVGIDGSLRFSSWENTEGKKQSKVEIHVENFQFLESRSGGGASGDTGGGSDDMSMGAVVDDMGYSGDSGTMSEDDIPF